MEIRRTLTVIALAAALLALATATAQAAVGVEKASRHGGKPGTPVSTPETAAAAQARLAQAWEEAAEQGQTLSKEQAWVLGCRLVRDLGDAQAAERYRGGVRERHPRGV